MKSFVRQTVLSAVSFLAVCRGGTCVSAIDCEPLRTASLRARRLLTTHSLPENQGTPPPPHRPGLRHREPDFRTRVERVRTVCLARPRCGVRMCTDLECSLQTLEGRHRMTNRRRTWETAFLAIRGQSRTIQQRGRSAKPYVWTGNADQIPASRRRFWTRTSNPGHWRRSVTFR